MSRVAKVIVVLGGYAASLGAAYAVASHSASAHLAPPDDSGGMAAFGDMILFLGVLGVCALVPTVLGLWFLRNVPTLWTFLSVVALCFAGAAVFSACILPLTARGGRPNPTIAMVDFVAVMLMFAAPVLAGAFLLSAIVAPTRRARLALAGAGAVEVVCVLPYVFWMVAGLNGASPLQ